MLVTYTYLFTGRLITEFFWTPTVKKENPLGRLLIRISKMLFNFMLGIIIRAGQ